MMTSEEYQKYKEAEKQHLRKLKELKTAVRRLEREKSLRSAYEDVSSAPAETLEKQKDLVDRLAIETAKHEARLEMALEGAEDPVSESPAATLEEDLQRERARALVRQLEKEMGSRDAKDQSAASHSEDRIHARESEAEAAGEGSGEMAGGRGSGEGLGAGGSGEGLGGRGAQGASSTREQPNPNRSQATQPAASDPTRGRDSRPEKTIGRM